MTEEKQEVAPTRQTMSLEDRIDVVDWLRARIDPIIADTKTAAAAYVSGECGVTMTASQLDYIIDSLPKHKLADKFAIGTSGDHQLQRRVTALEIKLETLMKQGSIGPKPDEEAKTDAGEATSEAVSPDAAIA